MSNEYWTGRTKAVLRQSDFSSDLVNRIYRQPASSTSFCNDALELFYNARVSIALCRDSAQKTRMTDALEDAAKQGFGTGVADLEDVFDYISLRRVNAGQWWEDDNVSQYTGGSGKFFADNVSAPTGIVNFAEAIDEAGNDLKDVVSQFIELQETVADSLRSAGNGREPDFVRIQNGVDAVSSWSEDAGHLLWLVDATDVLGERAQPMLDRATSVVGHVGTFAGHVGNLLSAMNTVVEMEHAGVNQDMARGLSALQLVSSQIPIFGQIFVEAIKIVPQLASNYQALFTRQQEVLENIARHSDYTNQRGLLPRDAGSQSTGVSAGGNGGRRRGPH